jgi:GDP-4-dehydro-6-deoxy-D-mannose reductase
MLTGANGFVGRHLGPMLKAMAPSAACVSLGRKPPAAGWDLIEADISDATAVSEAVAAFRPDVLVHLAAQSSVSASLTETVETWQTNFGGTYNIAQALRSHAPQATVLFVSTSEVYGNSFRNGLVTEDSPLQPLTSYARSKAAAEWILHDILAPSNRLIIARSFNHSGPGQTDRFVLASFASQLVRLADSNDKHELHVGNLNLKRDFLHVSDVCAAYLVLLQNAPTLDHRAIFNVCSGISIPLGDILQSMIERAGLEVVLIQDPARIRPNDISCVSSSPEKLRQLTGWTPRLSTIDIANDLIEYWSSKGS